MQPTLEPIQPTTVDGSGRVAALEAEVAGLRDDVRALLAAGRTAPDVELVPASTTSTALMGRRRAITTLAGVAVASTVGAAVLGDATPAAALTTVNLELNNSANSSQAQTQLVVTGSSVKSGLGVTDGASSVANSPSALVGHAKGAAFLSALSAIGEGPAVGVSVHTEAGSAASFFAQNSSTASVSVINGGDGFGIDIDSQGGSQLHLSPAPQSPIFENVFSDVGELRAAQDNSLWFCAQSGIPGIWRKVAGPKTAGSLHVLPAPVRVYDSRVGTQPSQGPKTMLTANTTRVLDIKANNSTVPFSATAVMVTVLLVNAAVGNGNFTIWANGQGKPLSNTMVWGGDSQRFTASTTTAVGPSGFVQVSASNTTDLVLDIVGYYL